MVESSRLNIAEPSVSVLTDTETDGSTSRSGSFKKNKAFPRKNPALHNSNAQDRIDELAVGIDVLSKRLSRRQAISTGVGVAAGVVGGLVIGGAAGYLAKPSSTSTTTATVTSPPITQTITSTSTVSSSLASTISSTSSIASGGPGIDYYYDPSLKGLTVNYVAGGSIEHVIIDPTFALFTQETGITVSEDLTEACVGTIGDTMFAAGSNEYDVLDAGALAGVAYGWWKSNYIVPWANFFDLTPSGWNLDDFINVVTTTCSTYPSDDPSSALLCLPLNLAINCMFYNTAAFTAAGATTPLPGTIQLNGSPTPGAPITFDELTPIIAKVQANNSGKYAYGVRDDNWFGNFAYGQTNGPWLYGQNWLSSDFTCQWTNQDVSDGWNLWLENSQKYTPDPVSMTDMEIGADGSAGTLLGMQWTLNAIPGLYGSGSAVSAATMPACLPPQVNNSATFMAGQSPVINAFSSAAQQKAAWSLCSFISSPRMQAVYNSMGTTGFRKSILSSPAAKAAAQGNYNLQYSLAAGTTLLNGGTLGSGSAGSNNVYASEPLPRNAQAFTIATTVGTELAKVQAGSETMATALNNLETSIDALLKQAGVYGTSYPLGTSG
jgi:ABC-type glycerol-3-phosphate transport system substrate-binding protein